MTLFRREKVQFWKIVKVDFSPIDDSINQVELGYKQPARTEGAGDQAVQDRAPALGALHPAEEVQLDKGQEQQAGDAGKKDQHFKPCALGHPSIGEAANGTFYRFDNASVHPTSLQPALHTSTAKLLASPLVMPKVPVVEQKAKPQQVRGLVNK